MPARARTRSKTPKLEQLRYGHPYCEACRDPIQVGQRVAWWPIRDPSGRQRWTAYCADCHHASVRAGQPLGHARA